MSIANIPHALSISLSNMTSSNGNIGIGTTTPAYPLDVVGMINASSTIQCKGVVSTSNTQSFTFLSPGTSTNTVAISGAGNMYLVILSWANGADANFQSTYLVHLMHGGLFSIFALRQSAYVTLTGFSISGLTATMTIVQTSSGRTNGTATVITVC